MSNTPSTTTSTHTIPPARVETPNPLKNPSYPQRVHLNERAHWLQVLSQCEQRLRQAQQRLAVVGAGPDRERFERLFSQMRGARDQVAESARRLPTETGHLYTEDRHRLEEAVAALDRIAKAWDLPPLS